MAGPLIPGCHRQVDTVLIGEAMAYRYSTSLRRQKSLCPGSSNQTLSALEKVERFLDLNLCVYSGRFYFNFINKNDPAQ